MEDEKQIIVNRYDWTTGKWIPETANAKDYEYDDDDE